MAEEARQTDRDIQAWCRKIMGADTPIFARTVSEVSAVAGKATTSASDLSEVVGHDASMATRLLRIAGSTLFNLQGRKIETISEAIVLIGFDAVRELAISLTLIEHVLKGRRHHRVTQHMARAFHAAAQAKAFAAVGKCKSPEEIFVAALLVPLGAMSFWAQGGEDGDTLDRLIDSGMPAEDAERSVLGFSLKALTAELATEWRLCDLLRDTMDGRHEDDPRVAHVQMGHRVASAIEQYGWDAKETRTILKSVADELGIGVRQVEELARNNLENAARIAEQYGVPALDEELPPLPESERLKTQDAQQPDAELQLQILTDLHEAEQAGMSLNERMHLILRGIHEGIGFDRTYFALLSPDKKQMQARYELGKNPPGFLGSARNFRSKGDLFALLLERGDAVVITPGDRAAVPDYMGWLSYAECAVMPVTVSKKPVGVLYADRAASRRGVDDEAFSAFRLFGQQIVAVLSKARG